MTQEEITMREIGRAVAFGEELRRLAQLPIYAEQGLTIAQRALQSRRDQYQGKPQVRDGELPAGFAMHLYCRVCGCPAYEMVETYTARDPACRQCRAMIDAGMIQEP